MALFLIQLLMKTAQRSNGEMEAKTRRVDYSKLDCLNTSVQSMCSQDSKAKPNLKAPDLMSKSFCVLNEIKRDHARQKAEKEGGLMAAKMRRVDYSKLGRVTSVRSMYGKGSKAKPNLKAPEPSKSFSVPNDKWSRVTVQEVEDDPPQDLPEKMLQDEQESVVEHNNLQGASEEKAERKSFKRLGLIIVAVALLLIIALLIVTAPGGTANKLKDCWHGIIEGHVLRFKVVNSGKMGPACQMEGKPHNWRS